MAALVFLAVSCAADGSVDPEATTTAPPITSPVTTSPVDSSSPTTSPVATAPATTSPVTTSPVTTSPTSPPELDGFERATITIGDTAMFVAVADSPRERARGLMFVRDLGDLDGMLFVLDAEQSGSFWMKNTLLPLDIAWFDDAGSLVGTTSMPPCEADPCPTYSPGAPFRYAVEAPSGALSFVDGSTSLVLP